MNAQEVFNRVVDHLRAQGKRAMMSGNNCVYRGPQGSMCAIGVLIPDDIYQPEIELNSIYDLLGRFDDFFQLVDYIEKNIAPEIGDKQRGFIGSLQLLHDSAENWTKEGIKESAIERFIVNTGKNYHIPLTYKEP